MADIAGAACGGLLAMGVAAGLVVMQTLFEAEISQVCGDKGTHNPDRVAVRYGSGKGSVTLGGRRLEVDRPRARTLDGYEVPLQTCTHFACEDQFTEVMMACMAAAMATRRHARIGEPVGQHVNARAKSTSKSAISRRFIKQTQIVLAQLMACDLS